MKTALIIAAAIVGTIAFLLAMSLVCGDIRLSMEFADELNNQADLYQPKK